MNSINSWGLMIRKIFSPALKVERLQNTTELSFQPNSFIFPRSWHHKNITDYVTVYRPLREENTKTRVH